jgi:hypothetical protein
LTADVGFLGFAALGVDHGLNALAKSSNIQQLSNHTMAATSDCLVLAMNDETESGLDYEDVPYVSYEYPTRYRKRITAGKRFIYYRGRRRPGGGRQPQVYLGTGIIGSVRESSTAGRLVCEILDGNPFLGTVPFKDSSGKYLEPGGEVRGYYVQGVREIPEAVYQRIVAGAELAIPPSLSADRKSSLPAERPAGSSGIYASPGVGRQVENLSREISRHKLLVKDPRAEIVDMPTNNPGFDLLTDIPGAKYVEVKGTQTSRPQFLLSEGERRFAALHHSEYLLMVVFGINLTSGQFAGLRTARGAVGPAHRLEPFQWRGLLDSDLRMDPDAS